MNASQSLPRTLAPWLALAVSVLVAGYFIAVNAAEYLHSFTADVYGRHWPVRNWMFLHIASGVTALTIGAVQLCLGLLRRTSGWHRWAGRAYVAAVTVACVTAMAALRHGTVLGPVFAALLVLLAACALLFTGMGLLAARGRHRQAHSAWMVRSYMAMMVFAWFRLALKVPVLEDATIQTRVATVLASAMLITFGTTELALLLRRFQAHNRGLPKLAHECRCARPY